MKRVIVAMSGGVDSSVAAALLKKDGYDVIGIMLRLWAETGGSGNKCCAPEAAEGAATVADKLDIPFYLLDYKDLFKQHVVDYFTATYTRGVTPNPCVVCNKEIRFGYLLQEALGLEADYLATGHYANVTRDNDGLYELRQGIDVTKDQTYMLFRLDQRQLAHSLFPVGKYKKTIIRQMADELNLINAQKADSQDLCFLGDEGQSGFLRRYAPDSMKPGEILTSAGQVVGQHSGLAGYTVGQRKGLGIAWQKPLYVLEINIKDNTLIVGEQEECFQSALSARSVSFVKGIAPPDGSEIVAHIRYRSRGIPAKFYTTAADAFTLRFHTPGNLIAPGQAVVLYDRDQVIGGGLIVTKDQKTPMAHSPLRGH